MNILIYSYVLILLCSLKKKLLFIYFLFYFILLVNSHSLLLPPARCRSLKSKLELLHFELGQLATAEESNNSDRSDCIALLLTPISRPIKNGNR